MKNILFLLINLLLYIKVDGELIIGVANKGNQYSRQAILYNFLNYS